MAFHQKSACVAVWSLSGVKSGQEIGKTLSIAQNGAKQVSKNRYLTCSRLIEELLLHHEKTCVRDRLLLLRDEHDLRREHANSYFRI
jgi:hypothetical protein